MEQSLVVGGVERRSFYLLDTEGGREVRGAVTGVHRRQVRHSLVASGRKF